MNSLENKNPDWSYANRPRFRYYAFTQHGRSSLNCHPTNPNTLSTVSHDYVSGR